jgi:ABC-2 type transport system permease protein
MTLRRITAIVRKEALELTREKRFLVPMIIVPILVVANVVWLVLAVMRQVSSENEMTMAMAVLALRFTPVMAVLIGAICASLSGVLAVDSFAGERERKTLEPLLVSPASESEIVLGKIAASCWLPTLLGWIAVAVFVAIMYFEMDRLWFEASFDAWRIGLLMLVPPVLSCVLTGCIAILANYFASMRSISQVVFLPLTGVLVLMTTSSHHILSASLALQVVFAACGIVLATATTGLAVKLFRRERFASAQ